MVRPEQTVLNQQLDVEEKRSELAQAVILLKQQLPLAERSEAQQLHAERLAEAQ